MSIFESIMLICFGASWPLAIYKTWKTKNPIGKSLLFLYLIMVGYIAGSLHKIYFNRDIVFFLYMFNGMMVLADIVLTHYYILRRTKS